MKTESDRNPADLKALIERLAPASVLAIGPAAREFFSDYLDGHPQSRFDWLRAPTDVDALKSLGKYDLAFVSHMIEYLDNNTATQLLARLRDVHSRRLLVVVPTGERTTQQRSTWTMTDMLAMGFVHIGGYVEGGHRVEIHAFDIANYKLTPDWLNSRYWANPELFDKYRW